MSDVPIAERRQHKRLPMATSVEFHHTPSKRDFPGRSVDVSSHGMLMYVPATVPVHPGQSVRLKVGNIHMQEFADLGERPMNATIVRVDRQTLLTKGHIAVGMRFDHT